MWIFLNNAFVSIVEHRDDPSTLIVRGRFSGDVERFLGRRHGDGVSHTPAADYAYRAFVARAEVEQALVRAVRRTKYPNFKDSIARAWRKALSMRVWSIMVTEQHRREGVSS